MLWLSNRCCYMLLTQSDDAITNSQCAIKQMHQGEKTRSGVVQALTPQRVIIITKRLTTVITYRYALVLPSLVWLWFVWLGGRGWVFALVLRDCVLGLAGVRARGLIWGAFGLFKVCFGFYSILFIIVTVITVVNIILNARLCAPAQSVMSCPKL